jgi:ATP synthase subunit 6
MFLILNNPLEQFEIISLINLNFGFFDLSFTNANLFCIFAIFFCLVGFQVISVNNKGYFVPTRLQVIYEGLYVFILNIVNENIGKKGQNFFPFIFSLFCFILLGNVLGLVPYSFTITSHFILTFSLSLIVWVGKLFVGFKEHGLKFFSLLLPGGVPLPIIPFFVAVELLSFFIPLVALGVRLFDNIIAGHILLKVIVGFCWSIITAGGLMFLAHFIPIAVLFLLLFLETAVAFIQAYIFTILSCLATGDAIKGGH